MKRIVTAAIAGALFGATGAALPASAQDQETRQLQCSSSLGQRQSCSAGGEVINAGITNLGSEIPCILGYTWGFEENGIWVANGCSAGFAITIVAPQQQQQASPDRLRERLKEARRTIRKLRSEVTQEREERQRIEGELSDAQAALSQVDQKKATAAKRKPNWAVRSVSSCGRKAVRENQKAGASMSRVVEIVSARPTEGTWLVIGRTLSDYGNGRKQAYFRCWVNKGKVKSFDNAI